MNTLCLITSHLPFGQDETPLSEAIVVATVVVDKRFCNAQTATKILTNVAARMAILQYAIVDGEAQHLPGYQLPLFRG